METIRALESNLAYAKQLMAAGMDGIGTARREIDGSVFTSPLRPMVWMPAAIGAAIGMFSIGMNRNRKASSRTAMAGLVGTVVGLCAGMAWASRRFVGPAARTAGRRVNAVRDARWLQTHPIDYA